MRGQMIGTLYTLGYVHPDTAPRIERLMRQGNILLVDIRLQPRSRWSAAWTRRALTTRYGRRYVWEQRLGNIRYQRREARIQLAGGHMDAVREAAHLLLQGTSLILLCACQDARTCHRSLVAKLIQDAIQTLQEQEVPL